MLPPTDFISSAFLTTLLATVISIMMPNSFLKGLIVLPIISFLAKIPVVKPIAAVIASVFKPGVATASLNVPFKILIGLRASLVL